MLDVTNNFSANEGCIQEVICLDVYIVIETQGISYN